MAPNPKFARGKYGAAAAGRQVIFGYNIMGYLMEEMNPELDMEIKTASVANFPFMLSANKLTYKELPNGAKFENEFKTPEDAERALDTFKNYRKVFQDELKKPENKKYEIFHGYNKFVDKILDTESGDFGIAMAENPYLAGFAAQYINGPRINKEMTPESQQEVLGGNGPLEPLNQFFSITADLIDREYERQEITENYTPEKEAEYLQRLNNDFKKFLENQEKIEACVNPDGTSPYDVYLQQKLDTFARKDPVDTISARTCKYGVENIRGQQKAIENGWGMNELGIMGAVYQNDFYTEREMAKLAYRSSDEYWKGEEAGHLNAIANLRTKIAQLREETAEKEKALNDLINAYPEPDENQKKEIAKAKDAFERAGSAVRMNETDLQNEERLLAELPEKRAKSKQDYKELTELHKEFQELKSELAATKITNSVTKSLLCEKSRDLLQKAAANSVLSDEATLSLNQVNKIIGEKEYKPMAVDEDFAANVLKKEDYDKYNVLFMHNGQLSTTAAVSQGFEAKFKNEYKAINDYVDNNAGDMRVEYMEESKTETSILGEGGSFTFIKIDNKPLERNPKENEVYVNALKVYAHYLNEVERQSKGAEKNFTRFIKAENQLLDVDNGNYLQALDENPFLAQFLSDMTGGAPDLFNDPKTARAQDKRDVDVNGVNDYTLKAGTRNVLMDFYEAGVDVYKTELEKQRDIKTGWTPTKEQKYLLKLDESYAKVIRAFEELEKIPREYQTGNKYMGNDLAMITGHAPSEGRDCYRHVNGLRWQRIAIKNGWSSRDLKVMDVMGQMEGSVSRKRMQLGLQLEDEKKALGSLTDEKKISEKQEKIQSLEERIKKINDWEKENLKPLKDYLVNKKISAPEDALDCISQINGFIKAHENNPVVKNNSLFIYVSDVNKYIIPTTYNTVLEEKNTNQPYSGTERRPAVNVFNDNKREIDNIAKQIREFPEYPREGMAALGAQYLREAFLNGMSKNAHPEIFNPKHPEYPVWQAKMNEYATQYAGRLLEVMKPADPAKKDESLNAEDIRKFADYLENGDHSVFFSDMKDRIAADAKKNLMEEFKAGRAKNAANDISLADGLKGMENAKASMFSGSELYSDIKDDLAAIEKSRAKFAKQLDEAAATKTETKVDENEKITFTPGKTAKIDEKAYNAYLDRQLIAFKRMEKYIEGKDKKIAELGGKPGDVALLGENGEKRYKAVKAAMVALRNHYRASAFFGNNGLTPEDREKINAPGFGINRAEFAKTEEYKNYLDAEKAEFEKNMKYNLIRRNKQQYRKLDECMTNEDRLRKELSEQYKTVTDEKVKAEIEAKMVASAEHTLYMDTVKDLMKATEKSVLKSTDVKDVADAKYEDLAALPTKLKGIVNSAVTAGKDGLEFKSDSKQYNAFKEGVMNKSPLQDSFKNMIIEGAKTGDLSHADITKMQTRILSDYQANHKAPQVKNPEKAAEKVEQKAMENAGKNGPAL